MKFDFKHLNCAALSAILFMSVYHVLSLILHGQFVISFLFLFNSVLSTLALLSINKPDIDNSKLALSAVFLSCFSFFVFMLTHLDAPNTTSTWFYVLVICISVLLTSSHAIRLNFMVIIIYWLIVLLATNRALAYIEPALTLTIITILISILGKIIKDLVDKLELSRKTDILTGCIKPDEFKFELAKVTQLFERYNTPFSLICIKYDSSFPSESELDVWLKELAQLYQSRLRKTDILCRFSSQKFMVLLPSTSDKNAVSLCSDLKKCAEAYEFSYQKVANPHNIITSLTFEAESYSDKDNLDDWLQHIQSK